MGDADPRRKRDLAELSLGYALVLAAVWSPRPWAQIFFLLGLLWVGFDTLISGSSARELGLTFKTVRRDYCVFALAAAMAVGAAFVSQRYDALHLPFSSTTPQLHAGGYIVWALIQQFLLQDYFLARLLRLLPSKRVAVVTAAALFASAHIPNPLLTTATLVWGVVACTLFLRYRDLYTLGIAHAILGLSITFTLPNAVHHNMRVGLGYLRYQPEAVQRSHNNQMVSTSECVMADAKMRCSDRHARP